MNGPTGSGKSSLCKLCFDSNDDSAFINVVFFCPGYKDSKQLLRALWQYIISKVPKATKNFQDLSNKKIADFKEFCDHFLDLVSNLPENIKYVNILLDDIDLMEQKTALNLSSLPQVFQFFFFINFFSSINVNLKFMKCECNLQN